MAASATTTTTSKPVVSARRERRARTSSARKPREFGLPNFNLGLTLKPLPITSVYVAYATSSDPVGSEFDGTSANYGGLAPVLNGNSNQIFGPEKNTAIEVGNKWELFDRHLLVSGALFQTECHQCA